MSVVKVVLREHGRLWRAGPRVPDGEASVPGVVLDRLRRHEERTGGETFSWGADAIKASQWVGVIHSPGLQLEILPKIDDVDDSADADDVGGRQHAARRNLLFMLAVSGDVPIRLRDLAALSTRRAPLSETLIRLFAERLLHELRRGPERHYVGREDNLRTIKGRLRIRQHLSHNAAHRERFFCAFEELAVDTPLNQVLKAACRLLLTVAEASTTQDALCDCLVVLDDVSDHADPRPLLSRIHITRSNERFRDLYAFCQLVFAHHAPTLSAGPTRTFSLLFDMNAVFERFIAGFLRRYVLPSLPGFELFPQARQQHRHLFERAGAGVLRLEPDLLLRRPDGRWLVIDTKWKRSRGRDSQQADLYQLFAYARRYKAVSSLLLYPHIADAVPDRLRLLDDDATQRAGTRFVRLHRDLHQEHERASLANELRDIVLEAAADEQQATG